MHHPASISYMGQYRVPEIWEVFTCTFTTWWASTFKRLHNSKHNSQIHKILWHRDAVMWKAPSFFLLLPFIYFFLCGKSSHVLPSSWWVSTPNLSDASFSTNSPSCPINPRNTFCMLFRLNEILPISDFFSRWKRFWDYIINFLNFILIHFKLHHYTILHINPAPKIFRHILHKWIGVLIFFPHNVILNITSRKKVLYLCLKFCLWTYWALDKMAPVLKTTISFAFSWNKIIVFWLQIPLTHLPLVPIFYIIIR